MKEEKLTYKEKMNRTRELKEKLFFHLKTQFTGPPLESHKIPLKVRESIWRTISANLQGAYSKGYSTGLKKGFADGLTYQINQKMLKETELRGKKDDK